MLQSYLHATLSAPPVKTLVHAVKNNWLATLPGISVQGIQRHLPKSIQTTMGHFHRVRQGIRLTKEDKPPLQELMDEETSPEPEIE